ncbi:hypothetical protein TNCV_1612601 [Trichonephila clavipes]|nr:hypothetical protein TNCV_1612601 [Trichonephila clavipes]
MECFTNTELEDMHMIYKLSEENAQEAERVSVSTHPHGPISKCLASPQLRSAVGFCNQRLMSGSTAMEGKQIGLIVKGNYQNNNLECLLELLEYVGHWTGTGFPNFFGQHSSISVS